jgi:myosin-crossreactive antigen
MSEIDQAQSSLMDFAALGSKLHDLLKAEEQLKQVRLGQQDITALTSYQQEIAVLADQVNRIRNSLVHSPLEDAVKQITSVQGSTLEAVRRWENLSRSIGEVSSFTEAVRKLTEATRTLDEMNKFNEMSKAMNALNEAKRINEAMDQMDELKRMDEAMRAADLFNKLK